MVTGVLFLPPDLFLHARKPKDNKVNPADIISILLVKPGIENFPDMIFAKMAKFQADTKPKTKRELGCYSMLGNSYQVPDGIAPFFCLFDQHIIGTFWHFRSTT